jgi:uncharacterized protein (DUF433 family)
MHIEGLPEEHPLGMRSGQEMMWPGIEKAPSVSSGAACIVRTGISVWLLENYRRLGWTEARILANYPTLTAADLVHAWAYVDAHHYEIDKAIRENEAA